MNADQGGGFAQDLAHDFRRAAAIERQFSGHRLEHAGTEGVQIAAGGGILGRANLLRRHVGRRAHRHALHRQAGRGTDLFAAELLRQSQVRQFGDAFIGDQHVGWFDVAVNDFRRMQVFKRLGDLQPVRKRIMPC